MERLSTGIDIRGGDDNNGDMEIEDVVKRIDALVECNSLKVEGNKNFVEFLFGGQSTGIGVNRVREILVEELQNHGDEIVLKYEG